MPLALITGGSSGIGLAIAEAFLTKGYDLIIVSKELEEVNAAIASLQQERPKSVVKGWAADLAAYDAADTLFNTIISSGQSIDVLVNNAGFGAYGYFTNIDSQVEQAMIDLNVRTVYRLTKLFLSSMVENNHGYIINISSVSAFFPSPYLATYAATKAFILHLGQAIHYELQQQKSAVFF